LIKWKPGFSRKIFWTLEIPLRQVLLYFRKDVKLVCVLESSKIITDCARCCHASVISMSVYDSWLLSDWTTKQSNFHLCKGKRVLSATQCAGRIWDPLILPSAEYRRLFPRGLIGQDMKLFNAEINNVWSNTSTPTYAFRAWCLIKHRNNFTFCLEIRCFLSLHGNISQGVVLLVVL
jgi:hypothetical protein